MIPADPAFHKPKSFIAAKNLLYASIFIGILAVVFRDYTLSITNNGGVRALILTAAAFLIIIILIKQMSLCKKWARTTLLILYLLALASYTFSFSNGYVITIYEAALLVFQTALEILAFIFLYKTECNHWFNKRTPDTLIQ
jgi:hypothetical protein